MGKELINYSKTSWEDSPSTNTPINATNLQNIEDGLDSVCSYVDDWMLDFANDVDITSPADGDILSYNSSTSSWENSTPSVTKIILRKTTATEDIQTPQVIGWDDELEKDSDFTHDTVTNNERVTVNSNGVYILIGNVNVTNTGANRVTGYMDLRINGTADTETRAKNYSRGTSYGDFNMHVSAVRYLFQNDYVDLYCGIDDADQSDSVDTQVANSEFMIVKLAPGAKGDTGAAGATGADGDITWEGDWSAGEYIENQAVANNGSSYVANTTTSDEPPSSDWDLLASKGDQGVAGTAKEHASFYLSTGGVTSVAGTETTLVLNSTASNSDGSVFSLSSNQVTVNKTGSFLIMGECYFNTGGSSRTEYTIWLESDSVDVPGTRSGIYARGYDSGSTGAFSTVSYVTSGTVFQMRIQRTDGAATTGYQDDNGTRLTFVEL
jgi:hypothetical protein